MQLSTNSNAAIIQEVRAQPTHVGQYRVAYVNWRDREMALNEFRKNQATRDLSLRRLDLMLSRQEQLLSEASDQIDRGLIQVEIEEIRIERQAIEKEIEFDSQLVGDAMRESAVYESEIARIQLMARRTFARMPEGEYQSLMSENHRQVMIRWIAAEAIAPMMGIPPHVASTLLSLPEETRTEYLESAVELINGLSVPMLREAENGVS